MSHRLPCPNGHVLMIPPKLEGKRIKCPKCQAVLEVPIMTAAEEEEEIITEAAEEPPPKPPPLPKAGERLRRKEEEEERPRRRIRDDDDEDDEPRARRRHDEDEEDDDRPRRRRRDDDDDEDDREERRPRRKKKQRSLSSLYSDRSTSRGGGRLSSRDSIFGILFVLLGLIILGGGLTNVDGGKKAVAIIGGAGLVMRGIMYFRQ